MALSQDVKTQFAKVAIGNKKTKSEETINGTYKTISGKEYVQLDGSDILTPVTSTVTAETGDRVKVLIKEHTATITGNITSPSARSKDLNTLKDEVDEYGNTIKQMDNTIKQQENSIIQINNSINQHEVTLNQHNTAINQQGDTIVSINNSITQQGNSILEMNNVVISQGNQIESMNNTISQQGDNINSMNNTIFMQGNKINQQANIIEQQGNTIVQQGNTINQIDDTVQSQGNTINLQGNLIEAHDSQLITHDSDIKILNSGFIINNGVLTGLSKAVLDDLETGTLKTGYAKIDFSNIQMAAVEKLFTDSGIIKDLTVEEGAITGELVGVTIKGDLIEGNTIVADKLVIKGSNGLYYSLNANGETIESEQTSENSLNGNIITAKSITASKIQVTDLVAFGATIGGFDIKENSINTHLKDYVESPDNGIYLDKDGQMALGDGTNYIKYYKDESGNYILDVRLKELYLGTSDQTADKQMEGMVKISANSLTSTFKTSGGSNLLHNSVGYYGTKFWTPSGNIKTEQDDEMSLSGSKFILTGDASLIQNYKTQPGIKYSVAFKYRHIVLGTAGRIKVELIGDGENKILLDTDATSDVWKEFSLEEPYEATSTSPDIKISVEGDDTFEITDLIISQGTNDVWSGSVDEVYGKHHQLDSEGLRLFSESHNYSSNTTSTQYQLKEGNNVISELSRDRVLTNMGEFNQGTKIGRLRTVLLDENNIIEYI